MCVVRIAVYISRNSECGFGVSAFSRILEGVVQNTTHKTCGSGLEVAHRVAYGVGASVIGDKVAWYCTCKVVLPVRPLFRFRTFRLPKHGVSDDPLPSVKIDSDGKQASVSASTPPGRGNSLWTPCRKNWGLLWNTWAMTCSYLLMKKKTLLARST